MRPAKLLLCAAFLAACGGDDDGNDTDIDAPTEDTDAGVDAAIDAAPGAPTVTITSHTDGQEITGSRTVTIAGALVDADNTITGVTVTVGAGAPVTATFDQTSFSASITLGDNANAITVTATDETALTGSDDVSLVFPYVALTSFQSATMVLGQPTFTSGANRAADAGRIANSYGKAAEIDGTLYVPDYDGDRILGFRGFPAQDGASADFVLGQPLFTTAQAGTSATRMDGPQTVLAHGGRMYSLEYGNARILIWNTPPTANNAAADAVIGQTSLTAVSRVCTSTGLAGPEDMVIAGGKLIVADADNNRVLIWNTVPTAGGVAPDLVLGQADFTHCMNDDDDQDGTADSAASLRTFHYPSGLWSDGTRLFVVDHDNHRVLVWSTFPTTSFQPADFVLGQPDGTAQTSGTAADRFSSPTNVLSNGNQLFIADTGNNRVEVWSTMPTSNVAADLVLGQADFTHVTRNDDNQDNAADGGPSARTMRSPTAAWFVRDRLFVTDAANNRVLMFGTPVCALNTGVYEFPAGSGTCIDDPCAPSTCTNLRTCDRTTGVAACTCPAGAAGADCDVCVRYVDPAGSSSASGLAWGDAYASVQSAADAAFNSGTACEVWIKEGTYHTYVNAESNTVSLKGNVTVRGGFAGNETTSTGRSGGATILDGRNAAGTSDVQHVVSATSGSTAGTPVLDRVTVQYGNADGPNNAGTGGGLFVASGARITVTDSVFQHNRAATNGGGIAFNTGTGGSFAMSGTRFANNYAGQSGGGAHLGGGTVTDCDFVGNTVGTTFAQGGGGLSLAGSGAVSSSRFTANVVTGDGGAIWVRAGGNTWTIEDSDLVANRATNAGGIYFDAAGSAPVLRTSRIVGNVAAGGGGGVFLRDASPAITNVTVVGNLAAGGGGGIDTNGSSSVITNAIVWGNRAPSGADLRLNEFVGSVTYSDVGDAITGTGNLSVAPIFAHAPTAWDRVTAAAALDTVTVTTGAAFAVGDYIEIDDDGVARQITATSTDDLTFTPALAAAATVGVTVENWAAESANLTADFHLGAGSPCIDAGTPAGTDLGAYP